MTDAQVEAAALERHRAWWRRQYGKETGTAARVASQTWSTVRDGEIADMRAALAAAQAAISDKITVENENSLTASEAAFVLRKWADALDIPSGPFVNQDLRMAADRLDALAAARAGAAEHDQGDAAVHGRYWHVQSFAAGIEAAAKAGRKAVFQGALNSLGSIADAVDRAIRALRPSAAPADFQEHPDTGGIYTTDDRIAPRDMFRGLSTSEPASEEDVAWLKKAAARVCWFDWSDNDDDAVAAIAELREALGPHEKWPTPVGRGG